MLGMELQAVDLKEYPPPHYSLLGYPSMITLSRSGGFDTIAMISIEDYMRDPKILTI